MKKITLISLFFAIFLMFQQSFAAVTITTASNTSISADKASNATSPAYTTLGNIVIKEGANADFSVVTNGQLILTAPSGWIFNSAVTPTITAQGGPGTTNITVNSTGITSSALTINITVSNTNKTDTITISGLQVQASEGGNPGVSVNITKTAGSDRKSTRLNSSHVSESRMPSSA